MSRTYFFILIAMLMLPISAMASFSDDFNTCSVASWTLVGSWSTESTLHTGGTSCNAVTSWSGGAVTRSISHATTPTHNNVFWSFDVYESVLGTGTLAILFDQNATSYNMFRLGTATEHLIYSSIPGWTNVAQTNAVWYRINATLSGNNIIVNIYDNSLSLLSTQTLAYTPIVNPTKITFSAATTANDVVTFKIDNVVVSSSAQASVTNIAWEFDSYTVGDSPSFTWSILDSDWNSHPLQIYVARLYKSGIMQDWGTFNYACLCSSQLAVGQSGTYVVSADVPGTYLVTLELMTPLLGFNTVADDSSTSVHAQSSSYFTIPTSAFIKTNTTATYHIGIGGVTGGLDWYYINNGVEVREAGKILSGTDGSITITFSQVGTYNVYLKAITGTAQTFQMHTVTTSFIQGTPENNFANNSISLIPVGTYGGNGGTYHMNDVLYGNYSIANTTFAANGVFFIDIFNTDAQAETTQYYGQGITTVGLSDFGTFALVISNNANDVFHTYWLPGNNSVRLMVQYSNGTFGTLATANFFLSRLNIAGYGMDISPLFVKRNQVVTAIITTPSDNATLEVTGTNGYLKTYSFNAGTNTIITSFTRDGIYGFTLLGSANDVQMSNQVTVSDVTTNNTNPAIPPISTTGTDISGLLQSKIFWTLVFIVGIMLAISMKERQP